MERFRPTFTLARRILAGQELELHAGQESTWVFLVDMNRVFEGFVRVAWEDKFKVIVQEQDTIGYLFQSPAHLQQVTDYTWVMGNDAWIGDAKGKLLEGTQLAQDESGSRTHLCPADVRQLTTYAELMRLKKGGQRPTRAIGNLPSRSSRPCLYSAVENVEWHSAPPCSRSCHRLD